MAAKGMVEDQIAARLGLDKNQLRRRHIDAIKDGRAQATAAADAAAGEQLSQDEETMRRAILAGYGTHWENADGTCDLHHGRTFEQQKRVWDEWLRRSREGNRVLPILIEAELFASQNKPVKYGDPI
jgi:hypothetical protein